MLPVTMQTVRLYVHVLAATVWVGGQLTLAGLVPGLREIDPGADDRIAEHAVAALRELLSNVARHAGATLATVVVEAARGQLRITVTDDGQGVGAVGAGGRGVANLRARASALGGTFSLETRPDRNGAAARWSVPT